MDNTSKYYQELIDIQSTTPDLSVSSMFIIMRDLVDKAEQDGIAATEVKDKEIAELRSKVDISIDLIDTFSGMPNSSDDLNILINEVDQALKQNER